MKMTVRLMSMKISKINCIQVVRDAALGLGLVLAKSLVENLPQDVTIDSTQWGSVCLAFEVLAPNPEDRDLLHTIWSKLSLSRQTTLLQYLNSLSMLRED
jgi:hypothetical protein